MQPKYCPFQVYCKDKPHKWEYESFLVCCAFFAFQHQFEIYQVAKQWDPFDWLLENKSGPKIILCNVKYLMDTNTRKRSLRYITIENYYNAVPLFQILLVSGFYAAGTIISSRIGFPKALHPSKKTSKTNLPWGSFAYCQWSDVPSLTAYVCQEVKSLNLLEIGCRTVETTIRQNRNDKDESYRNQPDTIPIAIEHYQWYMGGVDYHDQHCLRSCSTQLAICMNHWWNWLFSLLNMTITNAYILVSMIAATSNRALIAKPAK